MTCLRCGRALSAARSLATGYGPKCAARIRRNLAASEAKPYLIAKARELLEANHGTGILPLRLKRVFRTAGNEGEIYLTAPSGCNCAHGIRAKVFSQYCHHRIAVIAIAA